jgi:hypothetical protein
MLDVTDLPAFFESCPKVALYYQNDLVGDEKIRQFQKNIAVIGNFDVCWLESRHLGWNSSVASKFIQLLNQHPWIQSG